MVSIPHRVEKRVTVYREDSVTQVVYDRVKHTWWEAGHSIFVISQFTGDGPEHHYICWPRERIAWFRIQPMPGEP